MPSLTIQLFLIALLITSILCQAQQDEIENDQGDDNGFIATATLVVTDSAPSSCMGSRDTDDIENCVEIEGDFIVLSSALSLDWDKLKRIHGNLMVESSSLSSLEGLEGLEEVIGSVIIRDNNILSDFSGLSKLRSVGGDIVISQNQYLLKIDGLEELRRLGGSLIITQNIRLGSISLQSLQNIENQLIITGNIALTDINGLAALQNINGNDPIDLLNNGNLVCGATLNALLSKYNYHFGICGDGVLHISGELDHPRTFHSDIAMDHTCVWIRAKVQIQGGLILNSSTLSIENNLQINGKLILNNSTMIFQHVPIDSVDVSTGCVLADSTSFFRTNFTPAERKSNRKITLLTMDCSDAVLNLQNSNDCIDGEYTETYEYNQNHFNVVFGSCATGISPWIWTTIIAFFLIGIATLLLICLVKPIRSTVFPYRYRKHVSRT